MRTVAAGMNCSIIHFNHGLSIQRLHGRNVHSGRSAAFTPQQGTTKGAAPLSGRCGANAALLASPE